MLNSDPLKKKKIPRRAEVVKQKFTPKHSFDFHNPSSLEKTHPSRASFAYSAQVERGGGGRIEREKMSINLLFESVF